MRYPFDRFRLGTRYGEPGESWKCGWHSGLDMVSVAVGGDGLVYPLYGGEVAKIGRSGSSGKCVSVRHPDGFITLYAHLRDVYVKVGMEVSEKTVLGIEGSTGNSSGRHLHLEVHKGDYKYPSDIDPLTFIEERLEIMKKIKIKLNGVEKTVTAIEKGGNNYVKLQDLRDEKISVGYDAKTKMPIIEVVK